LHIKRKEEAFFMGAHNLMLERPLLAASSLSPRAIIGHYTTF
jgi:hypothetical protein